MWEPLKSSQAFIILLLTPIWNVILCDKMIPPQNSEEVWQYARVNVIFAIPV